REKLRFVPAGDLLSLLNTRWIVTDKVFDAWIEGVFYDLQFPAPLSAGQTVSTQQIPEFPTTALGLVSHLKGSNDLVNGTPVADVTITFSTGAQQTFSLKSGVDSAEGVYTEDVRHQQATIGAAWPYEAGGVDYVTRLSLDGSHQIIEITVTSTTAGQGIFELRGLSLIHEPTNTSRSVLLSTAGEYRQVHSGDVKIYENLSVLPRAFIRHAAKVVPNNEQAIAFMQSDTFDPESEFVYITESDHHPDYVYSGEESPQDQAEIISYTPERVEIAVELASPGWLLLTDTQYPGWRATVDGQPTPIRQANVMFRAVSVPEGRHIVLFEFKPGSLRLGSLVTGVSTLLLIFGLAVTRLTKRD
ncbi:MAG: YfhO family protein, partial [Chloroflexota bacterium]